MSQVNIQVIVSIFGIAASAFAFAANQGNTSCVSSAYSASYGMNTLETQVKQGCIKP